MENQNYSQNSNGMDDQKKLYLSRHDKMIMGVCGGLGEYFGIDPLVFRALFVLFTFSGGAGIVVYIILAIITPKEPGDPQFSHEQAKDRINEFASQVKQGAHSMAQDLKTRRHNRGGLVGLIIVLFGAALLLNAVFPQHWFRWDIFWPAVIILVGLMIIVKRK